ncbi:Uu.00g064490.m01.CDS01 [Anthostomella pinea]|uniref:Uu.00g064490.m01.CDS01 n=1 Tax=Anthostomella pinea TaxID=933095 RepID=A0AAI8VTL9_9PEZI|nr:Uu.00g064490.m01.CDS01 [Anthostomella pinea]
MTLKYGVVAALFLMQTLASPGIKPAGDVPNLSKRYFMIKPDGSGTKGKPWPEAKVQWCLDGVGSEGDEYEKLLQLVKDSWKLWQDAVAPYSSLQFEPSKSHGKPVCDDKDKDGEVLHIEFGGEQGSWADLGYAGKGQEHVLHLSPTATAALCAHELGHVFGLEHEHQKPAAWQEDSDESYSDTFPFRFYCANLADYDALKDRSDIADLCKDYNAATAAGFSAANWLPFRPSPRNYEIDAFVDLDSIMMYSSTSGSKNGKPVYLKQDESEISENEKPSMGDIRAIARLYPK